MTRTKTAGTSIGNVARAGIANRAGAALFLRIHADGSTDRAARGTHTLYPALRRGWTDDVYAESKRAARIVQARPPSGARVPRPRAAGALRLHGLQLGRRPGDPRRDGLHDEPDRGSTARDRCLPAPRRGRPLPRDASLPRPPGRALSVSRARGRSRSSPSSRISVESLTSPVERSRPTSDCRTDRGIPATRSPHGAASAPDGARQQPRRLRKTASTSATYAK